ncbi:ABC transporter permease [Actinacidiphila guanduensis]|jgi:ribose transport system permease protein|uniref:Monosaccharide ABC transporter membrane protein, CUT2 family n=1 Tax=Actinacidiphila guanduensis TaxID=310781 RepID=A0A1H0C4M8_9ACTN|nr:ABC transporter permease [Actinacidiphila guanduensis]SDN52828.1 monosaccharide ABC transporter membrane protein, CUT2 family [Actinacidiphila guanduensis]
MTSLTWSGPVADRARLLRMLQEYGVYAALVVLFLVAVGLDTSFVEMSNIRVQLFQVAPTLLVALGMALVIGTEGIDLSVGAVIALAASVVPLYAGYGLGGVIAAALLLGAASGAIGGAMVAFARIQPIVATLSLMIGVRGLAEIINGNSAKPVTQSGILDLGSRNIASLPEMAWIAAACALLTGLLVRRTTFGRHLVAVGDNRQASRLSGLPVRRVLMTVYMISGVLAALAGVLIVGHGAEADPANQGLNMELDAITAVVVGGTPLSGGRVRVLGTVAGALFMQLITAVLTQHNVHTSYTQIVEAAIICFAVYASQERGTR